MQLDLSYDHEFDYEQLARWYNIGSKEKDEELTADKLKNLPPILLAKLKQKFINPTSYFSTESPRKKNQKPEKRKRREATAALLPKSEHHSAPQLFSRKSTNDRSRNGRNHLRSRPSRLNPHRVRFGSASIKDEGFRGYFWENFGNLFAKQRLCRSVSLSHTPL